MERLLRLTDLEVGTALDESALRAAESYLQQTRFFADGGVRAEVSTTPFGTALVDIHTVGQVFIRKVEIDPGSALESEVEARVFLRSGQPYADDPEELVRQKEAIRQLFERDGYTDTQVTIEPVDAGPFLVDLEIVVVQGEQLDVQRVFLKGNEAIPYRRARTIVVDEFGFIRTYTESEFRAGQDALIEAYRALGFLRARVAERAAIGRHDSGGVDLFIEVREGARWEFAFEGNRAIPEGELKDSLPFHELGFIDSAEIAASARELESLYLNEGYYFADVQPHEEPIGDDLTRVRYVISEGQQAEVQEIRLVGNTQIDSEELLSHLRDQGSDGFESGGFLQPGRLESDIRVVEAYYRQRGFLWAHVPRWTVVADEGGRELYVSVYVEEGPRTSLGEVTTTGNTELNDGEIAEILPSSEGDPFDAGQVLGAVAAINRAYDRRGYQPEITSVCRTDDGREVLCGEYGLPASCIVFDPTSCSLVTRGEMRAQECPRLSASPSCRVPGESAIRRFDVDHQINEGDLIRVGEIFVQGNFQTDEAVLRRELPLREGAPFSRDLLLEGQANIRSLGLYDTVQIRTIGLDPLAGYTRDRVAIVVEVEEASSQYFEVRLGLASQNTVDNEFLVLTDTEFAYVDRNIFGEAIELRAVPSFGLDLTNPQRVRDSEFIAQAEVSMFDPRFYFWDVAPQPWELTTRVSGLWDLLSSPLNQKEVAASIQFLREFTEIQGLFLSFELKGSLVSTRSSADDPFEDALIVQISPVVTLDRRDSPINPTSGFRGELRLDLADDFLGEAFSRVQLSASQFTPIADDFVLGVHLRAGFALAGIASLFSEPVPEPTGVALEDRLLLPPSERFTLGGVANVRGFSDNGLGPVTGQGIPTFGDVVVNSTAELRFPLVPAIDLFGAYFVDAGQLQADFRDLNADDFRFSSGLGLRLLLLGSVPVVFDYGLVLNRQVGESIGQLHFNVGYSF